MKRAKRIVILVVVLAVFCGATFALTRYQEKQEDIKNSDAIILSLLPEEVTALSWESEDAQLAFHRGESGWLYDEDEAFPVSESKISDILSHFEAFGVSFIIENVEDYSQYGLDEPTCTLHLSTDEESYDIKLGNFSKMDEKRYVDIGDGCVYLVNTDPMDYLEKELSEMIADDTTPYFETPNTITFSGSSAYTIDREEESANSYTSADIYFTEVDGTMSPLDTEKVGDYLQTIMNLDLDEYATYNASEDELESCGLDTPELSIRVDYSYTVESDDEDGEDETVSDSFALHIGQNVAELAEYEAALSDEDRNEDEELPAVTKYVRIGDSQIVYLLSDSDYEALRAASYNDLRHSEVFWADFDSVTQLDITLEEQTHTLYTEIDEDAEDEDAAPVWMYQDEEVDMSVLKSSLFSLTADSFTDTAATEKEEISLTVHLENEDFPEVTIRLYRYDGSLCLAVVDGQTVSFVSRAAVMDLVEAVQTIILN